MTTQSFGQSGKNIPVYICMSDISPDVKQKLQQMGYSFVTLFDMYTPTLDEAAFRARINKVFPDSSATGIGVLDWEGPAFSRIRTGDPNSQDYKDALTLYTKAILIAKSMRPNMKWGYYALPFINRQNNYKSWNTAIAPLLQQCDVFMPSLYQYYPASSKTGDSESSYIKQNLAECLRLATQYNKMVIPFIWHRLYPDNKEKGLALVSLSDFDNRVKNIANTTYQGKRVDGLVWWGSDTYYFKQGNANMNREMSPRVVNFKNYHDSLILKYGNGIKKTLAGN
ncbi:MAG TPA: hypothetical protein VJ844_10840 [Mucilaginibacter sp.]|nr:hypothetical protein [Mucilaginibacter sp.]